MDYSRDYHRIFITLKQTENSYTKGLKPALGRCVMEVRLGTGKLTAYAQGLANGAVYNLCLISKSKGEVFGIDMGEIKADNTGKCDFKVSFDPNNIKKRGLSLRDINAVSVVVKKDDAVSAVLEGFTDSSFEWQSLISFKEEVFNEDKPAALENSLEPKKDELTEACNPQTDILKTDAKEEALKNDELKQDLEPVPEKTDTEKATETATEENEPTEEKNETAKAVYFTEADSLKSYIFSTNIKMNPFQKQSEDIEWVRCSINELGLFNDTLKFINNMFVNCAVKNYKHLLIGRHDGHIYLAVPSVYDDSFKTEALFQGFGKFKCCEDKKPENGDYGYWIAYGNTAQL